MPFSRILNRVLSYTEYDPEYHVDNQKVAKCLAAVDKTWQIIKISLYSLRSGYIKEFGYGDPISI